MHVQYSMYCKKKRFWVRLWPEYSPSLCDTKLVSHSCVTGCVFVLPRVLLYCTVLYSTVGTVVVRRMAHGNGRMTVKWRYASMFAVSGAPLSVSMTLRKAEACQVRKCLLSMANPMRSRCRSNFSLDERLRERGTERGIGWTS